MEDEKNNPVEVTPTETNEDDNKGGSTDKTFTQDDIDKVVAKRINEEKEKNKKAIEEAVRSSISEYERKAKLSQDEKEKEDRAKRDAEDKERERSITLREMKLDALEMLVNKDIPTTMVDFIVDVDKDKTEQNVEALAEAFSKAVESAVTSKLKGKAPEDPSKGNQSDKKPVQKAF